MKKYILLIIVFYFSSHVQGQDTVNTKISKADIKKLENNALKGTVNNIPNSGISISLGAGFSEIGVAQKISLNIRNKNLLFSIGEEGSEQISINSDNVANRMSMSAQCGYIYLIRRFYFSASSGVGFTMGEKIGQLTSTEGFLFSYKEHYAMIPYTQVTLPIELKFMTRPKKGKGVSVGMDCSGQFGKNQSSLSVMACLSAGIF